MKAIIICPWEDTLCLREAFGLSSPFLLSIGNKPLLEYVLDFCNLCGIREIRVLQSRPDARLREYYGDGSRWNCEISYGICREGQPLREILLRNAGMIGGDDLFLISGYLFFACRMDAGVKIEVAPDEVRGKVLRGERGLFVAGRERCRNFTLEGLAESRRLRPGDLLSLDSVKNYYELSMRLVSGEARNYVMHSYCRDEDIYIGAGVEIPLRAEVNKPVMLGDNSRLSERTAAGPGAIVGCNSLIDAGTSVINSIVMDNTYVGPELEIRNKIICRNRLIDPYSGTYVDVLDEFILTGVSSRLPGRLFHWAVAMVCGGGILLAQAAPWLLLRPFLSVRPTPGIYFVDHRATRWIRLNLYRAPARIWCDRLFYKFSLHKTHLVVLAMMNRIRLVGNHPLPVSAEVSELLERFGNYHLGVFNYSEMLEHEDDPVQIELDEFYYSHHAGLWFNLKLLCRTLVRNLFRER